MPSTPACRPSTHASASAVRNIGTDNMARNRFIHGPGLGSRLRNAGTKPITRNGSASPKPSPANTASACAVGSTSAAPSAPAMNGPVHGVATNAASAPVAKLPSAPPLRMVSSPRLPVETLISKTPARLSAIAVTSNNRPVITRGSCSWNAQPTCDPAARNKSTSPPSAVQTRMTPAA